MLVVGTGVNSAGMGEQTWRTSLWLTPYSPRHYERRRARDSIPYRQQHVLKQQVEQIYTVYLAGLQPSPPSAIHSYIHWFGNLVSLHFPSYPIHNMV